MRSVGSKLDGSAHRATDLAVGWAVHRLAHQSVATGSARAVKSVTTVVSFQATAALLFVRWSQGGSAPVGS